MQTSTSTPRRPPPESICDDRRVVRVLHCVSQMRPGGIETWLMRVLRGIDRDQFRFDFLVHTDEPRSYDQEILDLGCSILRVANPSRPWTYLPAFRRVLRESGPYDVVHSHHHHFSALQLWAAAAEGVPLRIAHSHCDTSSIDVRAPWTRRAYQRTMQMLLRRYCNLGLGVSIDSGFAAFGKAWAKDAGRRVLYCGVDLSPFDQKVDREAVRAELGIPEGAVVIGHVGRFTLPKNHEFFVRVAKELASRDDRYQFLLVGAGELDAEVRGWINDAGLADRFHLPGARNDVPRLMLGAIDVFLFPSSREGLPISLVEAQAAGLPCVYSDAVTSETEIIPELLLRKSLADGAASWADAVQARATSRPATPEAALEQVRSSPHNLERCIQSLEEIYGNVRGE